QMVSLLEKLFFNDKAGEIKEISASNLELGMILAEDVYTRNDIKIGGKWQEITETLYERIISLANIFGVKEPLKVIFPRKTL
ncbi:MAG: hypothetical protein N3A69_04615, partial [Leptospiraceae bacterium]|nr:hypothetical protein [Leptospiraceae bacterium]